MIRENLLHWDWQVYLEMFLAGIAAGAYVLAALLDLAGRGRSPAARTAHLIAFPLIALVGLLLVIDLTRPERFWHMLLMSQRPAPIFKWWSPMSLGSWAILGFSMFAFVSYVDALIDRAGLRLGSWRRGHTLHGSRLGRLWSVLGAIFGLVIAGYSGVLLSATNMPGWRDSALLGALFVASAGLTGLAAVLLIEGLRGAAGQADTASLRLILSPLLVWQLVMLVLMILAVGPARSVFLTGTPLLALLGAALLGVLLPLVLLNARPLSGRGVTLVVASLFVLLGGLLIRYGVVIGPQHG